MTAALMQAAKMSGDPFKSSDYFRSAEGSMARHWNYFIWPRINSVDLEFTLDLAAGYGRNTVFLSRFARSVICYDINDECLDACKTRFKESANVSIVKGNGINFDGIASESVSCVYSFDSMVHFEPEIVESFVLDTARILKPGGTGFFHHSNHVGGYGQDFRKSPHWRNFMSRDLFAFFAKKAQLDISSQAVVGWDESISRAEESPSFVENLDCISILNKA